MRKPNLQRQAASEFETDGGDRLRAVVETNPALGEEIATLDLLDDSALWNAAQAKMPQSDSERLEHLHRRQRLSGLSEAEAQELTRLEEQYERMILVRSHSTFLLEQRGHDIKRLIPSSANRGRRPAKSAV